MRRAGLIQREGRERQRLRQAMLVAVLLAGFVAVFGKVFSDTPRRAKPVRFSAVEPRQLAQWGQQDDGQTHIPPEWTTFTPPATGQSYIDPVSGCRVKRLTDSSAEETLYDGTHPSLMHYYSTFSPINATDTMLLISSSNGAWRVKDINGNAVVPTTKMPAMNNGHPVWDASDGNVFYYALGKALYRETIVGRSVKGAVLYTFKEYRGIVSPDAADLSQDGDHLALAGQNPDNTMDVFVWSLSKQTKTSKYTTSCQVTESITIASQPWAAISFFDDRKPGPELFNNNRGFRVPSSNNWLLYEDEIILARIDGSGIYRLAHARSRSAQGYWAQPRAAISRKGKSVVFTSNMAHPNGCPAKMQVPNESLDGHLIQIRHL